jgi:hypothetical protein
MIPKLSRKRLEMIFVKTFESASGGSISVGQFLWLRIERPNCQEFL